jgi:predicted transcriptional regulator
VIPDVILLLHYMRTTLKGKAAKILSRRKRECTLVREGIARGERAVEQGRVMTHAEARNRLARWLS